MVPVHPLARPKVLRDTLSVSIRGEEICDAQLVREVDPEEPRGRDWISWDFYRISMGFLWDFYGFHGISTGFSRISMACCKISTVFLNGSLFQFPVRSVEVNQVVIWEMVVHACPIFVFTGD